MTYAAWLARRRLTAAPDVPSCSWSADNVWPTTGSSIRSRTRPSLSWCSATTCGQRNKQISAVSFRILLLSPVPDIKHIINTFFKLYNSFQLKTHGQLHKWSKAFTYYHSCKWFKAVTFRCYYSYKWFKVVTYTQSPFLELFTTVIYFWRML